MTEKHLTDQKFTDLNLADTLKQGLDQSGFEFCTPIQQQSLPVALEGKDVAGQAQTGTGKTVAFLLAICHHLLTNPADPEKKSAQVRGLILAPTRELAIQIHKDAENITQLTGLKIGLVYGGTGYEEQKAMLAKGVDILIGTPGRLIDFYKQNLFGLRYAQSVVLDEADRMFDLGFIKDIRYLLRKMPAPEKRLNLLYSATLSFRVMELAYEHMNNPVEIKIDGDTRVAKKIEEYCFYPSDDEKPTLLVNLIKKSKLERGLVFVNTRHAVEFVSNCLNANDIKTAALSGDVPQKKREMLLEGFKQSKYRVLVATDVAARGLHIPEVSHVFNYDLPQDAEDYVHRIGRTARAGQSGEAISFLCERYAYSIMDIETYIDHAIPKRSIDGWMLETVIVPEAPARPRRGHKDRKPKNNTRSSKLQSTKVIRPRATGKSAETSVDTPAQQKTPRQEAVATTDSIKDSVLLEGTTQRTEQVDRLTASQEANVEKPKAKKAEKKFPFVPPKNRFSRKFGEIPLVG